VLEAHSYSVYFQDIGVVPNFDSLPDYASHYQQNKNNKTNKTQKLDDITKKTLSKLHTYTHTRVLGFQILWGLSIDIIIFYTVQTAYSVP